MRPPDTGAAPASGPPSSSKKDSSLEGSQGKRSMLASLASGAQLGAEGVARWDGGEDFLVDDELVRVTSSNRI